MDSGKCTASGLHLPWTRTTYRCVVPLSTFVAERDIAKMVRLEYPADQLPVKPFKLLRLHGLGRSHRQSRSLENRLSHAPLNVMHNLCMHRRRRHLWQLDRKYKPHYCFMQYFVINTPITFNMAIQRKCKIPESKQSDYRCDESCSLMEIVSKMTNSKVLLKHISWNKTRLKTNNLLSVAHGREPKQETCH